MRKAWTPEQIDTFMVELKRLFVENPRASFCSYSNPCYAKCDSRSILEIRQ